MQELGDRRHQQVGVLVPLLEQGLSDAPERRMPRLALLQDLRTVEDEEARVRNGLGHLLPCPGIATPEPRHPALAEQICELSEHRTTLPLKGLLHLASLLSRGLLLLRIRRPTPPSASAAAATATWCHRLSRALPQHALCNPSQEEGCNLRHSARLACGSLLFGLIFAFPSCLLQTYHLRGQTPGCIRDKVDNPRVSALVQSGPSLQEGKQERERLIRSELVAVCG